LTGLIISVTGNIRLAFMLVVGMFICAILVLRTLNLTKGKLDAEESAPIAPVTLAEDPGDEPVQRLPDELRGKEDDD
jgi:hypothetical protein